MQPFSCYQGRGIDKENKKTSGLITKLLFPFNDIHEANKDLTYQISNKTLLIFICWIMY